MGQVTYENHFAPQGTEFQVPGLGLVKNFDTVEVDETQVAEFKSLGHEWPDNNHLTIVIKEHTEDELVAELVDEHKKDELVDMAEAEGIEVTSGMTKEQLAEALLHPVEPEAEGNR